MGSKSGVKNEVSAKNAESLLAILFFNIIYMVNSSSIKGWECDEPTCVAVRSEHLGGNIKNPSFARACSGDGAKYNPRISLM